MPEIIEAGDPRGRNAWAWKGEWRCGWCGCRWRLRDGDQPRLHDDQRDGESASFPCPTCGREVYRAKR